MSIPYHENGQALMISWGLLDQLESAVARGFISSRDSVIVLTAIGYLQPRTYGGRMIADSLISSVNSNDLIRLAQVIENSTETYNQLVRSGQVVESPLPSYNYDGDYTTGMLFLTYSAYDHLYRLIHEDAVDVADDIGILLRINESIVAQRFKDRLSEAALDDYVEGVVSLRDQLHWRVNQLLKILDDKNLQYGMNYLASTLNIESINVLYDLMSEDGDTVADILYDLNSLNIMKESEFASYFRVDIKNAILERSAYELRDIRDKLRRRVELTLVQLPDLHSIDRAYLGYSRYEAMRSLIGNQALDVIDGLNSILEMKEFSIADSFRERIIEGIDRKDVPYLLDALARIQIQIESMASLGDSSLMKDDYEEGREYIGENDYHVLVRLVGNDQAENIITDLGLLLGINSVGRLGDDLRAGLIHGDRQELLGVMRRLTQRIKDQRMINDPDATSDYVKGLRLLSWDNYDNLYSMLGDSIDETITNLGTVSRIGNSELFLSAIQDAGNDKNRLTAVLGGLRNVAADEVNGVYAAAPIVVISQRRAVPLSLVRLRRGRR